MHFLLRQVSSNSSSSSNAEAFGRIPQESYLDPNSLVPSDTPHKVLKLFAFAQPIFSKLCRAADFLLWSLEVNFLQLFRLSQYLLCSDLLHTGASA